MGKGNFGFVRLGFQGICVGGHRPFIGKGDRCQDCQQRLRLRRKRKPR
jgi:hypothetical protein